LFDGEPRVGEEVARQGGDAVLLVGGAVGEQGLRGAAVPLGIAHLPGRAVGEVALHAQASRVAADRQQQVVAVAAGGEVGEVQSRVECDAVGAAVDQQIVARLPGEAIGVAAFPAGKDVVQGVAGEDVVQSVAGGVNRGAGEEEVFQMIAKLVVDGGFDGVDALAFGFDDFVGGVVDTVGVVALAASEAVVEDAAGEDVVAGGTEDVAAAGDQLGVGQGRAVAEFDTIEGAGFAGGVEALDVDGVVGVGADLEDQHAFGGADAEVLRRDADADF
jgi:hypothetical protein